MKLLKLNNEELFNAITSGDTYIQIGSWKFMLFEVDEVSQFGYYEVTDSKEEMLLETRRCTFFYQTRLCARRTVGQ